LSIEPGDTSEALDLIRAQRIDLALVLMPQEEKQFEFHPLFTDEMVFLTDPDHQWAKSGSVNRTEIPKQNYILYNRSSYTFRMVEKYFGEEKMVLNTVIELGSMEATKEFVKLGLGVSILAPWIAQKELREQTLVALPLGKRKLKRIWGIVCWRSRRLDLAQETFINLCRNTTEEISNCDGNG
jgi:DNA-binding transcriptional LysR family regulator